MTTSWVVAPAAGLRSRGRGPAAGGPHWTRLGDRVVVWSAGEADPARLLTARAKVAGAGRSRSELSLVTQVGRAFQDAHPRIPVVLDHGRHLVIDGGRRLRGHDDTCWRVEPLPADTVVVAPVAGAASSRTPGAVAEAVAALSAVAFRADLTHLASLPTRHSLSAGFQQAADWAAARLTTLGYAAVQTEIPVGAGRSRNVIADRPGTGPAPRQVVLVTAHLDSVNLHGGPAAPAPGADDNGSGSAGALALSAALAGHPWRHDVRIILFGGEEQGLHGSKRYVADLPAAERARIRAVLNMDMIGTRNVPAASVLLESAAPAQHLVDDLAAAAATFTGLHVDVSLHPFASDHVPFLQAGIPAVLTIEGGDSANGNIHSANDTLTHIDDTLALEILRMNAAACAAWLEPAPVPEPPPRQTGPVVSWGPDRLDVFVTGPDGALYHRARDESGWQPGYERLGPRP